MDTMLVVLRHALWSRDKGGLGWKHFVILYKGGAWWNRFPWARQIKENKCGRDYAVVRDLTQEIMMTQAQYCMKARFELVVVKPGTVVLKAVVEKKAW